MAFEWHSPYLVPQHEETCYIVSEVKRLSGRYGQNRGHYVSLFSQYLNITAWKNIGIMYFVDNDFDGDSDQYIAAKVNDKNHHIHPGYHKVSLLTQVALSWLSTKIRKSLEHIGWVITAQY